MVKVKIEREIQIWRLFGISIKNGIAIWGWGSVRFEVITESKLLCSEF